MRMNACLTGRAEKKRIPYATFVDWLVAPSAVRDAALGAFGWVTGSAVGRKNISDVSVSVCIWPQGDLLSIFCASCSDHSVHGFFSFCAKDVCIKATPRSNAKIVFFIEEVPLLTLIFELAVVHQFRHPEGDVEFDLITDLAIE